MGIPVIDTGPMTVEEFYALTDARPDGEKWELIDGEAVLNASPSNPHQFIISNVIVALMLEQRRIRGPWRVIPGIGALVSSTSRPEPDIFIMPKDAMSADPAKRDTRDATILFEICRLRLQVATSMETDGVCEPAGAEALRRHRPGRGGRCRLFADDELCRDSGSNRLSDSSRFLGLGPRSRLGRDLTGESTLRRARPRHHESARHRHA